MITTTMFGPGQKDSNMVSSRVGTNNPAFSRMPIEQRHLLIAQQMNKQYADQIEKAEVNVAKVSRPPGRGALFGVSPAEKNFTAEKAHKYFNRIDTTFLM